MTHPKIADVGVVGVPINGTELPRAYIVLRNPAKDATAQRLIAKEVQEWIKPRVGKPKQLRGGVIVVPEIPKRLAIYLSSLLRAGADLWSFSSPAGKILRRVLRESAEKEVLEAGKQTRDASTRL